MVNRQGPPIWGIEKPFELLQEATGEGLNAKYLADYLQEKYTKLYQL